MPHNLVKSQGLEIFWLLLSFRSRSIPGNTVRKQLHGENVAVWWLAFEADRTIGGSCFGFRY